MAEPDYEAIEQAEAVAVRAALERGYLKPEQLREALLLREQLRVSGRQTRLLAILGTNYIKVEHQAELSEVYFAHLNTNPPPPAVTEEDEQPTVAISEEMLFSSADELAIPEFMNSGERKKLQEVEPQTPMDVLTSDMPPTDVSPRGPRRGQRSPSEEGEEGHEDTTESGLFRWLRRQLPGGG